MLCFRNVGGPYRYMYMKRTQLTLVLLFCNSMSGKDELLCENKMNANCVCTTGITTFTTCLIVAACFAILSFVIKWTKKELLWENNGKTYRYHHMHDLPHHCCMFCYSIICNQVDKEGIIVRKQWQNISYGRHTYLCFTISWLFLVLLSAYFFCDCELTVSAVYLLTENSAAPHFPVSSVLLTLHWMVHVLACVHYISSIACSYDKLRCCRVHKDCRFEQSCKHRKHFQQTSSSVVAEG